MPVKLTSSAILLVLANMVPIFGVLYWGWDATTILVLYWLESVIIGVLNIPKILACRLSRNGSVIGIAANLFIAGFFTVHYGMFTMVHGVFLAHALGAQPIMDGLLKGGPIIWTAISFLVSHVFSMVFNFFGKQEYIGRINVEQMMSVYGRVIVMHLVVIFGGFAAQALGSPLYAVILLIALKTLFDLRAHMKEHERREAVTT